MILRAFVIIAAFAVDGMVSGTNKGDDSLLSALSKERQELKEVFRHENKELRDQDTQLQRENGQIRKRMEELQEKIVKMRDEKLEEENAMLKRENEKLRQVKNRQSQEKKGKDFKHRKDIALEKKKRKSPTNNSLKRKEVKISGGSAYATSNMGGFEPAYAFIGGNSHYGWLSASDTKDFEIYPKMIWYDFGQSNAFVPARVTFRSIIKCVNCNGFQYMPTVWEFVGSNDDVCRESGNWNIICQDLSDVRPQKELDTKFCDINNPNNNPSVGLVDETKYRCLGINVIRAHNPRTGLSNVRMWKKVTQMGGMKNATQYEAFNEMK